MSLRDSKYINRNAFVDCPPGCSVVECQSNQLQLDLDSEEAFTTYCTNLGFFREWLPEIVQEDRWESKSGPGHTHVVLTLAEDIDPIVKIAIQSALGSDSKRERLNLLRTLYDVDYPVVLFKPIQEVGE